MRREQALDSFRGVIVVRLDASGRVVDGSQAARTVIGTADLFDTQPFLSIAEHCGKDPSHECTEFSFSRGKAIYKVFARARAGGGFQIVLADITREKEAEETKTEFVALASHQLRTPLSVMKWLIERGKGPTGHAKFSTRDIARLAASNEQMITLVNDLLNVARLEAGKLIPEPLEMDLRGLTQHILDEFGPRIKEKRLQLETHLGAQALAVFMDTKFLHEILTNLVSNAVKYTPARGRLRVTVRPLGAARAQWVITDTGVGIPAREQRQIFNKFFRGENVSGTEIEGTGLGLYVVRTMVEASGGTITCISREGKGSTFTLTLPRTARS